MIPYQRKKSLDYVEWEKFAAFAKSRDSAVGLDCWKYEDTTSLQHEVSDFRLTRFAKQSLEAGPAVYNVEDGLSKWLWRKEPFNAPSLPQNAGKVLGGLRLLLCDRPNMQVGMSISRHAFESIEAAFELHPATIPALFYNNGVISSFVTEDSKTRKAKQLHLVVKASQKIEVANCMLSLTFDVSTCWTTAFLCGYGAVNERDVDCKDHGSQLAQLTNAILASPGLWNNPLFLPYILLQTYYQRSLVSADILDQSMIELESKLGATRYGESKIALKREEWLCSVDPQQMTVELHVMVPQCSFILTSYQWLQRYADFLLKLAEKPRDNHMFQQHLNGVLEIRDSVRFLSSAITGETARFDALLARANLQVNLLWNIISQQDALVSRWDSRLNQLIARSAKQDSISMTTFTFITALFLPGTFIATLFSMTMFDWQLESGGDGSSESNVSNKFWVFWVIAVPLTIFTMSGWYFWFKFANSKWIADLKAASSTKDDIMTFPEVWSPQAQNQVNEYCWKKGASGGHSAIHDMSQRLPDFINSPVMKGADWPRRCQWITKCRCTDCSSILPQVPKIQGGNLAYSF